MSFASPLPWWLLVLALGAACLVAYAAYSRTALVLTLRQRVALGALRLLSLLLIIFFLQRPVLIQPITDTSQAVVPVLIDASRSMALADEEGGRTRAERAAALVRDQIAPELSKRFQVELLSFGERLAPVAGQPASADQRRSDVRGALAEIGDRYAGRAVAGVVIVSDGGDTGAPTERPSESGPPVFPVGVGAPTVTRDREVSSVTIGEAPLADSSVDLTTTVVSHGFGREPIEVHIIENGQPVQVRQVTPSADGTPRREVFRVSPSRDAPTVYTVEVPAQPSELTAENNRQSVLVRPPGRARRLLVVEGGPGFDHSFLKRAWARDGSIEADSVVRKGHNDRGEDTFLVQASPSRTAALQKGFPLTREALFVYDAVILANVEADFFTADQLGLIADFVSERGGGLLVLGARSLDVRGLASTSLEEVLPLELTDRGGGMARTALAATATNRVTLTKEGESHPVTQLGASLEDSRKLWAAIPALSASTALGTARPGATVLALTMGPGGAPRPLIAVQPYGRGRSMVFTGEGSWRWRMQLPSNDQTYDRLWRQVARWLSVASADPVSMSTTTDVRGDRTDVRVEVRDPEFAAVADADIALRMTDPAGRTSEARATLRDPSTGTYGVTLLTGERGVYRIEAEVRRGEDSLGSTATSVLVGGVDSEFAEPRRNDEVLSRLAAETGGRVLAPAELPTLPDLLAEAAPGRVTTLQRDLWHNAWSFLLVMACLCAEWSVRRRWGLK